MGEVIDYRLAKKRLLDKKAAPAMNEYALLCGYRSYKEMCAVLGIDLDDDVCSVCGVQVMFFEDKKCISCTLKDL